MTGKSELRTVKSTGSRIPYLDVLRIFATFAMVMLHVAASKWSSTEPVTFNWLVYNFYNSATRWCVPVFVMISGALFLNREVDIKKLYSKNIVRIIAAFIFWSVLYGIISIVLYGKEIKLAAGEMIVGHYHMWFLFMIVGVYITVPILKKTTESEKITKYFLALVFVFAFVTPMVSLILPYISESLAQAAEVLLKKMEFSSIFGYTGYFVLGYFLFKTDLSKAQRKAAYFIGIAGFIATYFLAMGSSMANGKPVEDWVEYCTVNVLLESIGVFVFFKYVKFDFSEKALKIISTLSKYSFGVYLVHLVFWEFMQKKLNIDVLIFNPIISIPLLTVVIALLSWAASAIIHKIPILNKYIV